MKKQENTKVPKLEKGNVLRDKMNRWLDQNSSSLSKTELRELRKGLQDLNPDMFYSLNDGGNDYQTYMKSSDGKWENKDAFGSGIDKRSGKTSSNRSGFLQGLTGGRRESGYGGKENPRRIRDIITKAVELGYLRNIKSEQGDVDEDKKEEETEIDFFHNLGSLVGTKATNMVSKNGVDFVVVTSKDTPPESKEIPVKIDDKGIITEILAIEDFAIKTHDKDGNPIVGVDPFNTGVDTFDKSNTQDNSENNSEEEQTTFTDGTAFQRFLIQKAKDKGIVIAKDVLKVKTKTGELLGIDYDGKVGPATMALARLLGYADLWVGGNTSSTSSTSSTTSSTGSNNSTGGGNTTGSTGNNSTGSGSGTADNTTSTESTTIAPTDPNAYFKTQNLKDTEYGQKIAALRGNESLKFVQSLMEGFFKETKSIHPNKAEILKKHSSPLLVSNSINYEGEAQLDDTNVPLNLSRNIKAINTPTTTKASSEVTSNPKKEGTATEKADIIRQAQNSFRACKGGPCNNRQSILQLLQNYKDINNGKASSFESEVLEYLKSIDDEKADKASMKAVTPSLKKGGEFSVLTKEELNNKIKTLFNLIVKKENKEEDLENLETLFNNYKTKTKIEHHLYEDFSKLKNIKKMKNGGTIYKSDVFNYLNKLNTQDKKFIKNKITMFKKGGVVKYQNGGMSDRDSDFLNVIKEYFVKEEITEPKLLSSSPVAGKNNMIVNQYILPGGKYISKTMNSDEEWDFKLNKAIKSSKNSQETSKEEMMDLERKVLAEIKKTKAKENKENNTKDFTEAETEEAWKKADLKKMSNGGLVEISDELRLYLDGLRSFGKERELDQVVDSYKLGGSINYNQDGASTAVSRRNDYDDYGQSKIMIADRFSLSNRDALRNKNININKSNYESAKQGKLVLFDNKGNQIKTNDIAYYDGGQPVGLAAQMLEKQAIENKEVEEQEKQRQEYKAKFKAEREAKDKEIADKNREEYLATPDNTKDIVNEAINNKYNSSSDVYIQKAQAPKLDKYPKGVTEQEFINRTGGKQDTRSIEEKIIDEIRRTKQEENIENNTRNFTEEETQKAWEDFDKEEAAKKPKYKNETTSDKANLESKTGSAMVKNLDKTYDYKRDNNGIWSYAKKGTKSFIPIDNSTKKGLEAEAKLNSFYEAGDSWSSKASNVGSADTYKDIKVDNDGEVVSSSEWDKQATEELAKRNINSSMKDFDANIDTDTDVSKDIQASINEAITSNDIVDIQHIPGDEMGEENVEEIKGLGITRARDAVKDFFTRDEAEKDAAIKRRLMKRAERKSKRTSSYSSGGNLDRINFIKRAVR